MLPDMLQVCLRFSIPESRSDLENFVLGQRWPAYHITPPKEQSVVAAIPSVELEEDIWHEHPPFLNAEPETRNIIDNVIKHIESSLSGKYEGEWQSSHIIPNHRT
eukprot:UN18739